MKRSFAAKFLSTLTALVLLVSMVVPVTAVNTHESEKLFYTTQIPSEMETFLQLQYSRISPTIAKDLIEQGVYTSQVSIGVPVSISNDDNFYYVPLLHNNKVVYIICVGITGNPDTPYSLTFGKLFADELNALPTNEVYEIVTVDDFVYAVSENEETLLLRGSGHNIEKDQGYTETKQPDDLFMPYTSISIDNDVCDVNVVNLHDKTGTLPLPASSRAAKSKTLNVPYVANAGNTCWLASSLSIVNYKASKSLSVTQTLHDFFTHGTPVCKSIPNCKGGNLQNDQNVLHYYLYGNTTAIETTLEPASVIMQIDSNKPILTSFGLYINNKREEGHAIVLCGYLHETDIVIYTFMDPNHANKVNVGYTTMSGLWNDVTYYYNISGNLYKWDRTIYGIF